MNITKGNNEIAKSAPDFIRIEDLKELLIKYDGIKGSYPENEYEGQAVWSFLNEMLNLEQPSKDRFEEIKEIQAKCHHEFPLDEGFGQWISCEKCGIQIDSQIYKKRKEKNLTPK